MKDLKNIYELIDYTHFRERPHLYLGKKAISDLKLFMMGYHTCEFFNGIKSETQPSFWLFYHWICKIYNHDGSYHNWDGIILQNANNNEEKAFDIFLEKFDEFREYKPLDITFAKPSQISIDYFNSHNPRNHTVIDGKVTKTPPSNELYIVEYSEEIGSAIHYKQKNQFESLYTKTKQDAIEKLEMLYGNNLQWQVIEKNDFESVYKIINNIKPK